MICELPEVIADSTEISNVLNQNKSIAVVGMSSNPAKPSHYVPQTMLKNGYEIIPVNPNIEKISGLRSYKTLLDLPIVPDIVNIFRPSQDVPQIVDDAIKIGAKVIWMQLGIVNNEAANKAREAGLVVVMNKCIKVEYFNMVNNNNVSLN